MSNDVLMPQMGESIAEGTIVRWIKKVGDRVDRDEPLFEISTDKVDAEIPSPAAGVLTEIRAKEGETVPVNSVVAIIAATGTQAVVPAAASDAPAVQRPGGPDGTSQTAPATAAPAPPAESRPVASGAPPASDAPASRASSETTAAAAAAASRAATPPAPRTESAAPGAATQHERHRSSPLVRRIAKDHNVDIGYIVGTGIAGRVTKKDILAYLDNRPAASGRVGLPGAAPAPGQGARVSQTHATGAGLAGQTVPLSVMRRKIAEHMVLSKRTSAHVHTVFHVNFGQIDRIRKARKAAYEQRGAKLTYLAFIVKAAADALRDVPVMNASLDAENNVVYHKAINVGVAVSLDWGLIVPVIKNVESKDLFAISSAIVDLAERARTKQLKPDDVAGGTFTITNPGGIGAQFGLPIINQPQVGILGVGAIEKRVVVLDDDAIAVRPMAYLSLAFDHRVVDGAVGDQFMATIKHQLETWDPSAT